MTLLATTTLESPVLVATTPLEPGVLRASEGTFLDRAISSAAATLPALTVSATIAVGQSATGEATLPALTAAATMAYGASITSGAASLPALTAAASMAFAFSGAPAVAGYAGWWDASNAGSVTLEDTTRVINVADLSGNGRNFYQTSASLSRPTLTTAAQNGLDAMTFDGSNDYLAWNASLSIAQPGTFFMVVKKSAGTGQRVLWTSHDSTDYWVIEQHTDGTSWSVGTSALATTGGTVGTSWQVVVAVFNGASSAFYVNGSSTLTGDWGATAFNNPANAANIGRNWTGGQNWNGLIGEWGYYTSALSGGDVTTLSTGLQTKWGI